MMDEADEVALDKAFARLHAKLLAESALYRTAIELGLVGLATFLQRREIGDV